MAVDIVVMKAVNADNEACAARVRSALDSAQVLCLNLMSSPGSGKTSLLEALLTHPAWQLRTVVVEGDVYTKNDAERIAATGTPALQVNTEGSCHMTASMIEACLPRLPLSACDLLVIENIGNLICPAAFRLGEHLRLALLSTTEGSDKPEKYPRLFEQCDAIVLTKMDLAEILDFDPGPVQAMLHRLNPAAPIFATSAKTGAGLPQLITYLETARRTVVPAGA